MKSPQYYIDLLPGVPIVESPFFQQILDGGYFTKKEEQIAIDLNQKGYAVLDFPDVHFDERAERIKQNLTSYFEKAEGGGDTYDGSFINKVRFQDAYSVDADVLDIATNKNILRLLKKLYGRQSFPFQTLNFKVGTQQHIHSDAVHFNSYPEKFMCGVWVAMEDITPENGPLQYHPGSHKIAHFYNVHVGLDLSSSKPIDQSIYHDVWNQLVETHKCKKEHFYAKKGQALIWSAHLLHGGEKVIDRSKTRWSQVTHYYFENSCYFTPMHSEPFLGQTQFREPLDISKGRLRRNIYLNNGVDKRFLRENIFRLRELEARKQQQLRAERKSIIPADFNPNLYLQLNPDIAQAGADPVEHYLNHGFFENRRYK